MAKATVTATFNQFNVRLVKLIQTHPVLYDHTLEGYTNYQMQEKIWQKISNELHEDVPTLKIKWKNLRSSYTRYLRHAARGSRNYKRSYYLSKHLTFLLPFCKSRSNVESYEKVVKDAGINPSSSEPVAPLNFVGKIEPIEEEDANTSNSFTNYNDEDIEVDESSAAQLENNPFHDEDKMLDALENCDQTSEEDPDLSFLKSLLPDMKLMDGKQKSKFKIAILNAAHSTLYE